MTTLLFLYNTSLLLSVLTICFVQHDEIAELRHECAELRMANANLERLVKDSASVSNALLLTSCSHHYLFLLFHIFNMLI